MCLELRIVKFIWGFNLLSAAPCFGLPEEVRYQGTVVVENTTDGYVVGGAYDDETYGPLDIGFSFTFYGVDYTRIVPTSNGFV